jgi:hypothetical protein
MLLALSGCTSSSHEAPLEMPSEVVTCGVGNGGEILGTVHGADGAIVELGTPAPSWVRYVGPGGSDAPPGLVLVDVPRFVIYNVGSVDRMLPSIGEYTTSANVGDISGGAHVIIDVSDTTTGCLAGRFEADFNSEGSGRLVGWFRTL